MSTGSVDIDQPLQRRSALQSSRVQRLRRMVEIRLIEDRVLELFGEGLIPAPHTPPKVRRPSVWG